MLDASRPATAGAEPGGPGGGPGPAIAAVTMARDEDFFLPIWAGYFGRQLGPENLFVVDHASDARLMEGLRERLSAAINVIRIPLAEGARWNEG